ncbi:hypothetical protein ZIOFF_014132 [Zingiber officinale]|uniref:Uncharacterized protein n=1 Tax=Zingiber officinale TaxID=94328 RepID=A0A8J5HB69_ZINOF|nr:hypothetical protein ZIOFF_014132 [Zingiber officinale]
MPPLFYPSSSLAGGAGAETFCVAGWWGWWGWCRDRRSIGSRMKETIRTNRGSSSRSQKEEETKDENRFFATKKTAQQQMGPALRSCKRRRHLDQCSSKPLLYQHRQILSRLLDCLTNAHQWKEASGVLSLLLKATPEGSSLLEDRRNFLVAMEIQRRFYGAESHYQTKIKKIYDIWMSKLQWMKEHPKKRNSVLFELAVFSISQGNFEEALCNTKIILQDPEFTKEPTVNLFHGLILYEMWYSGLPEDMKIKGCDVHIPSQISDTTIANSNEEPNAFVSSNEHNAMNVEDGNGSSIVASESSICVEKNILDFKETAKQKNSGALHATELSSRSDLNDMDMHYMISKKNTNLGFCVLSKNVFDMKLSILDFCCQCFKTNCEMIDYLERVIHSYRGLVNEQYNDAVKHLRLALHSTPPCSAALLPLVQLHLLGDRVEEALTELDGCCQNSRLSEPFRLKARILECFQSNQVAIICTCYEAALRRDSTCNQSLQRLIKMHRIGNYGTIPLFDMIVLNLDSTDGDSSTWEEFAVCFLKILTSSARDFEDHISITGKRVSTALMSDKIPPLMSDKIPRVYTNEGHWRRCYRWWRTRHFNKDAILKDIQQGDKKLLASKAACASHMYGPHFDYIEAVYLSLSKTEDASLLSFLQPHLKNSTRLEEILGVDASSFYLFLQE